MVAGLVVVMLASGCTVTVDGAVRPAQNLKPRPLTGQTVKQVLLDAPALSKLLDQPFKADSDFPPKFGDASLLRDHYETASPPNCVGVTDMLQKSAYQSAKVQHVARESWWHDGYSVRVLNVEESVVALPTATDADALFTKFSQQWRECDGMTMTGNSGQFTYWDKITNVRVANSVVAATVSDASNVVARSSAIPTARAIGVRVNCLVEVEVSFFSSSDASDRGTGDINTSAIDIAHLMMDKVTDRS